jgi:hypothetical protein
MTTKSTKKDAAKPLCDCGCGETTKGGRYLAGHDAKHKSALVQAALGGSKRAETKLEQLGWTKFLDAKRSLLAKKEAKAAKKTAKPEKEAEEPKRRGRKPAAQAETAETSQE